MRQIDLLKHLVGHELPPQCFSVLGVGNATGEGWVLEATSPEAFRIAYFERGRFSFEQATFADEAAACEAYLALVRELPVVVMTTADRPTAEAIQRALATAGIGCRLNPVGAGVFGAAMIQMVVAAQDHAFALRLVCHEPMRPAR